MLNAFPNSSSSSKKVHISLTHIFQAPQLREASQCKVGGYINTYNNRGGDVLAYVIKQKREKADGRSEKFRVLFHILKPSGHCKRVMYKKTNFGEDYVNLYTRFPFNFHQKRVVYTSHPYH